MVTENDIVQNAGAIAALVNAEPDVNIGDLAPVTTMADADPLHVQVSGVDSQISKLDFEKLLYEEMANGFDNKVDDGDFIHNNEGNTSVTTNAYVVDVWKQIRSTDCTATITPEYDSDIQKNKIVFDIGNPTPSTLVFFQSKKGVDLNNGKNLSMFCKLSSTLGWNGAKFRLGQNFGTGGSATVNTDSTVQNVLLATSEEWFRFDLTVPSISGKTIGADNFNSFQIRSDNAQSTDLTVHAIRVIETPTNIADDVIPEWIKQDEDPLKTFPLVNNYAKITDGNSMRYRAIAVNANKFTFFIEGNFVQLPSFLGTANSDGAAGYGVSTIANALDTGYTFSVDEWNSQGVIISATKTAHGLTDGVLKFQTNSGLSARY